MTTLAEASVEIVAETADFDQSLRRQIEGAGGAADRASQGIGTRIGRTITDTAQRALRGLGNIMRTALDPRAALTGLRNGLTSLTSSVGTLSQSFAAMGSRIGGAFTPALNAVGRFRDGFTNASAAASAFSGRMGTLGGVTRTAVDGLSSGFNRVRTAIDNATQGGSLLNSTLGRLGALAGGLAAAAGIASLGTEIATVASSAQTTEASLEALYGAAGGGAREVNEVMSEMATRFRGLDMSVMNEGATTLAYMGLQGSEAVDVLERLDAATTAAGTGATGMTRALDAMTKGVNAGKFMMGELSQISNAGIPIYDALADVLGVDIPEAQAMASAGAIDLEDVLAALSGEAGTWFPALLEGAQGVGETFAGSWSTIRNTFVNGLATELVPLLDRLSPVMARVAQAIGAGFEILPGLIDSVISRAGDAGVFDTLMSIFDGFGDVLSSLAPFFAGFAEGFTTAGDAAMQAFQYLEPLGNQLSALGDFLSDNADAVRIFGSVLGGLVVGLGVYRAAAMAATLASQVLSVGLRGIGVAIRGIPLVGWALAAIGALIALYQTSERFREIVNNAFSTVRDAVAAAWVYIEPVWDTMVERLSALWNAISGWEGWSIAWEGIKTAVSEAWDTISGVWDALTSGWESLTADTGETSWWTSTWETLSGAVETAWDTVSTIFDQIAGAWALLAALVSGDLKFSDVGEFIGDTFSRLGDVGSNIGGFLVDQLRELPGRVVEALGSFGSTVGDFLWNQIQALPGRIRDGLATLSDTVSDFMTSIPERAADAVGADDGILEWMRELPGKALERLQAFGETIVEYLRSVPDTIRSNIDPGAIVEWLQEVPGRITEFMSDYGMQILRGFAIAIGVVVLGIPALLLGLLAAILVVLGTIAWELIQWAWGAFSNMMVSAGEAVLAGLNNIVQWFINLPEMIMTGISNMGARLAAWATGAIASMRTALTTGMNAVRTWWNNMWSTIFSGARGAWNTFQEWVINAAGRVRDGIMGPIDTLKTRMIGAFDAAKVGIEKAWDGVRSVVAKPIEWVVNTAYDDWLRGVWGKVVEKFGGPELPSYTVAFKSGGVFPGYTPGRDVHSVPMAAFSGGESVLRPEVTRAWGAGTTHMLNKLARSGGVAAVRKALMMLFSGQNPFTGMAVPRVSPKSGGAFSQRFATGGILGRVTGAASGFANWLGDTTSDFSEAMLDFLDDPGGMLRKLFDDIMDYSAMPEWGTGWTDVLKNVPEEIIKLLIEKAKSLFSFDGDWMNVGGDVGGRLGAALGFARQQAGKPYIWGGVGPRGYDCSGFMSAIHNVILGKRPYSRRYSTHPFTGNSFGGFRRNMPSPFTIGVTHAGVGHMAGTLLKTNVESRGSAGAVVGARARGTTNSLFSHRYGLAVAGRARPNSTMGGEGIMFDSGGWLRPGVSMIGNFTGKPESIRTAAQEKNVENLVQLLQRRVPLRNGLVPDNRRDEFVDVMRRAGVDGAMGGTTINAPVSVHTYAADPETVAYKTAARIARLAG